MDIYQWKIYDSIMLSMNKNLQVFKWDKAIRGKKKNTTHVPAT